MTMPNSPGASTSGIGTETEAVTGPTDGGENVGGARGQIRQVKDQVVDQAKNTFREARDKASSSLGDSRRQAADQIGGIASAFHSASAHLRDEEQERIAGLADSLAGQVDQVANYLRDANLDRMVRDVENLARRQPALVFGAAIAIGLIGARFLKSSDSSRRRRSDLDRDEYSGQSEYDQYTEYGGIGGPDVRA
ncbi:MAG: hypothetical protein ACAI18_17540 [Gemmatimonadales bacterium]